MPVVLTTFWFVSVKRLIQKNTTENNSSRISYFILPS